MQSQETKITFPDTYPDHQTYLKITHVIIEVDIYGTNALTKTRTIGKQEAREEETQLAYVRAGGSRETNSQTCERRAPECRDRAHTPRPVRRGRCTISRHEGVQDRRKRRQEGSAGRYVQSDEEGSASAQTPYCKPSRR